MLRMTVLLAAIFLTAPIAQAQTASLTHIFPQVVDGVGSDGTVYKSRFIMTGSGASPATCQISLFDLGSERLSASARVEVQQNYVETIPTRGVDALDTGYARLDCSQPVVASLTYSIVSASGSSLGIATVPSAPDAGFVLLPMVLNGRSLHGIAIANDNDALQLVTILFDSGTTSLVRIVQLQPRSQYVAFAEEIFQVPSEGLGTLRIAAVDGLGADKFSITALLFDLDSFTNIVPAVIR